MIPAPEHTRLQVRETGWASWREKEREREGYPLSSPSGPLHLGDSQGLFQAP